MRIIKKLNLLLSFFFGFVLLSYTAYAQTYYPIQKPSDIQSVTLNDKNAMITMSDYVVTVPLTIMKNTDYSRANGITPKGMKIGLKYNDILLRLVAVDKSNKNYMVADFITKDKHNKMLNLPVDYKKPINDTDIYIASIDFIKSYPFWSANSVARGFDLLATKEKGIITLFPAILLELADKLCRADTVTAGIFELLPETQKITCDNLSVLTIPKNLKNLQKFANQERPLLVKVLECSQGNRQPALCQKINQELANKTLHSVTPHLLLTKIKN